MVFSLLLALATHTAAPEPVRLDRISVTARHEALAAQRPEAVTALTAGTIEAIGASHANEVFARVPGAWISRGSGQEQLTAIRSPVLSGTGACGAFLFLEDGVPIRPTGFCNVNQLFELGTEQAGRIEVLRGPGAAVHGSNALHGVVNVVPRSPAQSPRLGLAVEAGPDDWRKLQATAADADGERWWRLDLHGVSTGSFRPEEGYDQQKLGA
jgi:iron complex outermembrane receptor protein